MRAPTYIRMLAMAALLPAAGCLQKDTTETWYLEPDGRITWVVMESDVRSDAQTEYDRRQEEAMYGLAAKQDNHPMARALRQLGPIELKTIILRGDPPFSVRTEARFARIDALGQRLIERLGSIGTSVLRRDGAALEWTLTIRDPHATEDAPIDDDLAELSNGMEALRVVLINGRMESAAGFEISSDKRVATFREDLAVTTESPVVVLTLKWTPLD